MEETIKNFPKQFEWEPQIQNEQNWKKFDSFILVGMGGSHLQGDIFQAAVPGFNLSVHQDYGIPQWPNAVLKETLIIASSYSGNTEETLNAFQEAIEQKLPVAAFSIGGKLLELAKQYGVPYIQIPDTGIQPRMALGFVFKALAKMVGREDVLQEAANLAQTLNPAQFEDQGKALAEKLKGKIPVIYASNKNYAIAYNWKIKFNEAAKIPAFYNLFPELNHNEIAGFNVNEITKELSSRFYFLFLKDADDGKKIQKRMEVTKTLYEGRGLPVECILLAGQSTLLKIFSSLLLADWVSLYLARHYGVNPEQVPIVEEFKKLIV